MSGEPEWRDVDTREGYDRWASTYDVEGNPLLALEEPEVDRSLGDVAGLDVIDRRDAVHLHPAVADKLAAYSLCKFGDVHLKCFDESSFS